MSAIPRAPAGTGPAGRRLWRAVLADYELREDELALLRQAAHTADVCEHLQAVVDEEGPLAGDRAHPGLVELRQQRIVLARLLVALRLPVDEDDAGRTQYRGTRGVYGIRGIVR